MSERDKINLWLKYINRFRNSPKVGRYYKGNKKSEFVNEHTMQRDEDKQYLKKYDTENNPR